MSGSLHVDTQETGLSQASQTAGGLVALAESSVLPHGSQIWMLLGAYSLFYIAVSHMLNVFVLTPEVIASSWIASGYEDRIDTFAESRAVWQKVGYGLTPVFVVIRVGFTAICLAVGCALMEWEVPYAALFRVALVAEAVWVTAAVTHLLGVLFVVDIDKMSDYTTFYPLSLLHIVRIEQHELWSAYLLKSVNAFEVMYGAAIALNLKYVLPITLRARATLVIAAYGAGLAFVVAAVTFLLMSVA